MVPTVEWKDGAVRLLDQSRLPEHVEFLDCRDYQTVAEAIRSLKVRGAPAIGVTAAMGVALGAQSVAVADYEFFAKEVRLICDHLAATRPTAVNLFWAIERMKRLLGSLRSQPIASIKSALLKESQVILDEDIALCKAMGQHGAKLIASGQTVLTHCNAGALATAGYGTALGVIRAAWDQGKNIQVIADETRPVLQGAVKVLKGAEGARNYSQCDSMLLGDTCGAHTFPYIDVANPTATVEHEASTSKIGEDQIFYFQQRGISKEDAVNMIVNGFCKEVFRELPMEFAVEAQKLLGVSLEGSVG
jgi:eIF-2B alpha/beta/delta-like uncharacterized protein